MSREYLEQKLERLEKQLSYLERRISELERSKRLTDPYQPFMPSPVQPTWTAHPSACSVCGLKFDGPMGYVCTNPRCPSGVVYCQSET